MNQEKALCIARERWLDALHIKGGADGLLQTQMDEVEEALLVEAVPRTVYRVMKREAVRTAGSSIERHLEGCENVVLLGATLGIGVDNLIRRVQVTDMAKAVLLDSGASVLVQQVCDELEMEIRMRLAEGSQAAEGPQSTSGLRKAENVYLTSRFSPGYGDYPLAEQSRIVRLLDARRAIGLNVTASSLMIPRKSITALMGMASKPVTGQLAVCGECVLRGKCTLRKEGKFCGDGF